MIKINILTKLSLRKLGFNLTETIIYKKYTMYCEYYKAKSLKSKTWFVFGTIRNEENMAFGRTLDKKESILELFVAPDYENHFIKVMNSLKKRGYILEYKKSENRLKLI